MPCEHYWIVETSTAPIAQGVCSSCGLTKQFANQIDLASKRQTNVRKDITLVGSPKAQYWENIAESFARDL